MIEGSENKRPWRRLTREVMAGNVGIGGKNPVQGAVDDQHSDTRYRATVEQILRIADAGADDGPHDGAEHKGGGKP
jgi:hypothetical protein